MTNNVGIGVVTAIEIIGGVVFIRGAVMTVGVILLMIINVYISPVSPLIRSEAMFFFVNRDQYFPI